MTYETKLSTNFTIMKFYFSLLIIFILSLHLKGFAQDSTYTQLDSVVVNANKLNQLRKEVPIAISVISANTIKKENSTRIDFLLNKVSGIYMPSIGNERHMMSIRQPISLKGLYLYLEDGMPIRTSGLFSSNALIEINTGFTQRIEIMKGPASALYGAEAIGGVLNFLTLPSPEKKTMAITSQMNSIGYKKIELNYGFPNLKDLGNKKGGWVVNVNWGGQQNGPIDYSNYEKKALSVRHDFLLKEKWKGYQTLQYIDYYSQMTGSVDSTHFFGHNFNSLQTFTYRQIYALRFRQNLEYQWNENNLSVFNFMYRDNTMNQNPTYSIASTSSPLKFKGQTNSNVFNALVLDVQHYINLPSIHSKLIFGGSIDHTQQNLKAHYIDIIKDTALGKYTSFSYPIKDSLLTFYETTITNAAMYLNVISKMGKYINLNIALRYDAFDYAFHNQLNFGTPSTHNQFNQFTPKLGFTFNKNNWGAYLNYSKGFVPPQITKIYNTIKVPYLLPQTFNNMELGSWLRTQSLYAEFSLYKMLGENEIISVRQPDGVNLNQNAGSTKHIGIEYQLKYNLTKNFTISYNGTNAKHNYINTLIKGVNVSGNEMNAAPQFWSTLGLEWNMQNKIAISLDWQHQDKYYMDETNTTSYGGFNILNYKLTYHHKRATYWLHVLNLTDTYYSTMATKNFSVKGNAAYSYYLGEPRSIAIGYKWSFGENL
jgi:iron complex outermembrane receptor protein